MLTDYGKYLRRFLIKNHFKIQHILDLRDSEVFKNVVNYPCIVILSKGTESEAKSNLIKCVRVVKPMDKILDDVWNHFEESYYEGLAYDLFLFPQRELDENTWKLMPDIEKDVFDDIDNKADVSFGQLAQDMFVGTQTSADDVYLVFITKEIDKSLVKVRPQKNEKEYVIEKQILRPLLKGKDVSKWVLNWSKHWLVFPYKKRKLISKDELQKKCPHAWAYLSEYREVLEGRENGKMKGQSDWYGYIYPKNHDKFEQIKMMTQLLSTSNRFALDNTGKFFFIAVGGDCITLKESYRDLESYLYVLSVLNSNVLEYYLKHISPVHSGGFYLYIKQYLQNLPIKLPTTNMEKKIAERMIQKVEKILQQVDPKRLLEDFPEAFLHEYRSKGVELDEVEYTFNADHIELEPFISGLPGKGYVVYPTKGEDSIWVDTKEKARYLVLALRNRKVKQNETVKILILRDNSIVTEILEGVKKTIQEIKATPIDQLEEEINELVYQLYGLSKDDKAAIESFLTRF